MKRIVLISCLLLAMSGLALAHDGTLNANASLDAVDIMDSSTWYKWQHDEMVDNEAGIFKGYADITVTNQGPEAWGDFHIVIFDGAINGGSGVVFDAAYAPTATLSDYTAEVTPDGKQVNFEFYNDPVAQGETVTFSVYTDNTVDMNQWFTIAFYPTPVPEPATMAMLGFGGLAALVRRKH